MPDLFKNFAELAKFYHEEKAKWIYEWTAKIVPPVVLRWANEKKNIKFVSAYLQRNKINLVEHPDGTTDLVKNGQVVSEFRWQLAWLNARGMNDYKNLPNVQKVV